MLENLFHKVSYVKFVFYIWGGIVYWPEIIVKSENFFSNLGFGLFLFGIAMCFEGFMDETKFTRLEMKLFKRTRLFNNLFLVFLFIAIFIVFFGLYVILETDLRDFGYGIISFAIGNISIIKQTFNRLKYFKENYT